MTRPIKKGKTRNCHHCGARFEISERNIRKVFCSDRCRWESYNIHRQDIDFDKEEE
jgi:endogenous inhibitor of DNA gyrase (YacG/DUF329 family)